MHEKRFPVGCRNTLSLFAALGILSLLLPAGVIFGQAKPADDPAAEKYYAANALYNRKLYSAAIPEYREFLQKNPNHSKSEQARLGLALCCYASGNYREAEPLLKGLIQAGQAGDQSQLHVLLGQCQVQRKAMDEAEKSFEDGVKAKGAEEFRNTCLAALTDLQFKQNKWTNTVEAAERLLKYVKTGEMAARAGYQGAFARFQLKQYKEAIAFLERLSPVTKGVSFENLVTFLLAECKREAGDLAGAAEQYALSTRNEKGAFAAEAFFRLGYVNFYLKEYDKALDALGKSLKEQDDAAFSCEVRLYLGRSYLEKKSFNEAFNNLRIVSQATNDVSAEATLWMARTLTRQNAFDQALKIFEDELPRFKGDRLLADLLFDYAEVLLNQRKNREAAAAFKRIESERHAWYRMPDVLRFHALCLHRVKDYSDSLSLCERYIQTVTNNPLPEVFFMKAENTFILRPDNVEPVLKLYTDFVTAYPKDSNADAATLRIAQILNRKGEWAAAVKTATPLLGKSATNSVFTEVEFIVGDSSFRLEAWKEAVTNLDTFVKRAAPADPNADTALMELGLSNIRLGQTNAALANLSMLVSRYEKSPHVMMALAETGKLQYEGRRFNQAREALERIAKNFPESAQRIQAEYYLGWVALDEKKDAEAQEHFAFVVNKRNRDQFLPDSLLQLGLLLMKAEKYAEAQNYIATLTSQFPDDTKADQGFYAAGVIASRLKDWNRAANAFKALMEKYPNSTILDRAVYEWAWVERNSNNKPAAAKQYEYLLKNFPKSELAERTRVELAEISFDSKNFDAVIAQLKDSVTNAKDKSVKEQAMFRLAWAYLNKGDAETAAKAFESMLAEFPKSDLQASASYQAGECRLKIKEYQPALDHFQSAVKAQNNKDVHESALLRVGEMQGILKQWPESVATYRNFQRLFPESKWIQRARFGAGWAFENNKEYQNAVGEYRKVVEDKQVKDDLAARSQFQIGECMFAMKEYDRALQELVRVQANYSFKDWSAKALLEMGRVLETKGDKPAAIAQFKEVIQKYPGHEAAVVAKERMDALR